MPTGNPSETPMPHSAAPAIATGSEPPKTTSTSPTTAHTPNARVVVTRPWRSSTLGPNQRASVIAERKIANVSEPSAGAAS